MKKILLAGTVILSMTLGFSSKSQAQEVVTDIETHFNQLVGYVQDLKNYAVYLRELEEIIHTVEWVTTIANGLIHNPNLGQVMSLLNALGVMPNLPVNLYAIQGLISGYGGMGSIGGLLSGLSGLTDIVNTSYSKDKIYECHDDTFSCNMMKHTAASNAGLKGMLGQLYDDVVNHQMVLQHLRSSADKAVDVKDAADVANQIHVETTWTSMTQTQVEIATAQAQAQDRVRSQQKAENIQQEADAFIAAARSH